MLAPAEKKYSQVEREGLAVVFGVKHFHKYLFGREFKIITDHKPLLGLFKEDKATSPMASARIQRWALTIGGYHYKLQYQPGKLNANADGLSRLPLPSDSSVVPDPPEVVFVFQQLDGTPVTASKIGQETRKDPNLSAVSDFVLKGWPAEVTDPNYQPYFNRRNEITVHQECLLWGSRVIVPQKFQLAILTELHEAHPGVVKMKSLARSYVWWPGIDDQIEKMVRACIPCQECSNKPAKAPLHPWEFSDRPFSRIHIDFAGPLEGKWILIIIDASSKFVNAHVMNRTSTALTLDKLRQTFASHGLPRTMPRISQENPDGFQL